MVRVVKNLRLQFLPGEIPNAKTWNILSPIMLWLKICYIFFLSLSHSFSRSKALQEARDINLHLQPLQAQLLKLEKDGFLQFEAYIPALFHTIFLIWTNCQSYQRPARIVVLLQELCNLFIEQVRILIWITVVTRLSGIVVSVIRQHFKWLLGVMLLRFGGFSVFSGFSFKQIRIKSFSLGFYISLCGSSSQRGHRWKSTNGEDSHKSLQMFQTKLPDPEGEVGQSCETCTLGFPICHDFCTFQEVP